MLVRFIVGYAIIRVAVITVVVLYLCIENGEWLAEFKALRRDLIDECKGNFAKLIVAYVIIVLVLISMAPLRVLVLLMNKL